MKVYVVTKIINGNEEIIKVFSTPTKAKMYMKIKTIEQNIYHLIQKINEKIKNF